METTVLLLVLLLAFVLVSALSLGLIALVGYRLVCLVGRGWLSLQSTFMLPGPRREVIRLRVQLTRELQGAREAVSMLNANRASRGDLASLVRRLERMGQTLNSQLRILGCETDEEILRGSLPQVRQRVEELAGATRSIRQVSLAVLGGETDDNLHRLTSEVEQEVVALQAGVDAMRALEPRQLEDKH